MNVPDSPNFLKSSYRERLVEHLFLGDLLKYLWLQGVYAPEVLKPSVAHSGYDVVIELGGFSRHIELKAKIVGGRRSNVDLNIGLAVVPSGCAIWVEVHPETLELGPFWWLGNEPGSPLPDILEYPIPEQTRGSKKRLQIRRVPKSAFTQLDGIGEVARKLFGDRLGEGTHNSGLKRTDTALSRGPAA